MPLPDIDTVDTYGGELVDYAPVEDPTTDQSGEGLNALKSTSASLTHTAARAWARFQGGDGFIFVPDFTATNSHDANWGNDLGVRPVLARTGTGVYTLTWPSTVTDELGEAHAVNFRWAKASFENQAAVVNAECTAVNVVTIRVWDMAGAAADYNGKVIFVEAG